MHDGFGILAGRLSCRNYKFHESRIRNASHVEIIVREFGEYCGAKRPEFFPELDPHIDDFAHFIGPRIGKDASIAKCARSKFHASLEPPNHLTFHQRVGDIILDAIDLVKVELGRLCFEGRRDLFLSELVPDYMLGTPLPGCGFRKTS